MSVRLRIESVAHIKTTSASGDVLLVRNDSKEIEIQMLSYRNIYKKYTFMCNL